MSLYSNYCAHCGTLLDNMSGFHLCTNAPRTTTLPEQPDSDKGNLSAPGGLHGQELPPPPEMVDTYTTDHYPNGHTSDQMREYALSAREPYLIDAQRYRWLRDTLHGAKAGGGVEVNDALQVYEQPKPGEVVRIYWYPDTPVGFCEIEADTLDAAIDAAGTAIKGAKP